MKEITGNIFDFRDGWIGIPTNCDVDRNGLAIMGKGLALEAAKKCPSIKPSLGNMIKDYPAGVCFLALGEWRFVAIPTKFSWRDESANLKLIEYGIKTLWQSMNRIYPQRIYLPRLGCGIGTGNLNWELDVKPLMEKYFGDDERFMVVSLPNTK